MDNPYSSPTSGSTPSLPPGGVTPGVIQALAATKPWVRLCSVIGFIMTGFIVLAALAMFLFGGAMAFGPAADAMPFAGFPAILGVIYLASAFFYFFPSLKLWKYGSHILDLMGSQSVHDLEAALESQRSFWKFVGILILVAIGLYALTIVIMIGVGVATGMSGRP